MKCADLQPSVRDLRKSSWVIRSFPETCDALEQVASGIAGVGDGKNFCGIGEFVFDQTHHAAGQHRGLARTCSGDRENWSVDVVNGLSLLRRKFEFAGLPGHRLAFLSVSKKKRNYIIVAAGARSKSGNRRFRWKTSIV